MSGFQVLEKHGVEKSAFIPSTASFASFAKLFLFFLFVYVSSFTAIADAATYYVSPSGSGTTCSSGSPCTLATGLGKSLVGDDHLILKDGTYTGTSLNVPWSGTEGHPIVIEAENDGQAIVDGQNAREPFWIAGIVGNYKHDITVEGIVFKNSSESVVNIVRADRIIFQRVSAYNASATTNDHVFNLWYVTDSLLEDCVAAGPGRVMIDVLDSDSVTLRRCHTRWTNSTQSPKYGIQIYGTTNAIVENCVTTVATSGVAAGGITVWSNWYSLPADNNKIYGNVTYNHSNASGYWIGSDTKNLTGNQFINNVAINSMIGFHQRADDGLLINNFTSVSVSGSSPYHFLMNEDTTSPHSNFKINTNLKNSSFITGGTGITRGISYITDYFNHTYNNLYNLTAQYSGTTAGTGEIFVNPAYDTATYGNGAYLIVPAALQGQGENGADIGAEVIHRYVDGVITSAHLWPWPMEDRIKNETSISVTYASNGGLWGGTWEATKDWNEIYGGSSDATPPAAPQGLLVQ